MRERYSRRGFLGVAGGALGLLATPVLARACGGPEEMSAKAPLLTTAVASPEAGDVEAVVRIEYVGGFVPPAYTLSQLPIAVLYADGRLITQGPQIEIFPGPALPNVRQTTLTAAGVEAVLATAAEAGLTGEDRRYENFLIADAPYTLFTVTANGKTTRVAAYALGIDGGDPNQSPEEREARLKLVDFQSKLVDAGAWLPTEAIAVADESYPIERMQAIAEPFDPSTVDPNDPTTDQPEMNWPIATPISSFTPPSELPAGATTVCGVVAGEEVGQLVAAAEQANVLTPWLSEGELYRILFRPLLPDETGCPPRPSAWAELPPPEATPAA